MVVKLNQSFFDIAAVETGITANAFAIAMANNKSITEKLQAGAEIIIPIGLAIDKKVVDYYATSRSYPIEPASFNETENSNKKGIGYMAIGIDFKVG